MSLAKKMSLRHEKDIAETLGLRVQPGSGNQWANQGDAAGDRTRQRFAFTVDCKATRGESIGVSASMWEKIVMQSGGERPALALRWYGDDGLRIVRHDLVVVSLDDFVEVLEGT